MHAKLEYLREHSPNLEADIQIAKCMEASYFYITRHNPSVGRYVRAGPNSIEPDILSVGQSNMSCTAWVKPLEVCVHIMEPVDCVFRIGIEYVISHEFRFPNGKLARQMSKFLHEPRSYELGRTITEQFDDHDRLIRITKQATVQKINVGHIAGPIIAYLKMLK
jgi:hypothetical protein